MQFHKRNRNIIQKRGKKSKFKFPLFYVIYGALMIAAFIAIFIGLGALSSFLYDYENSLPKYVAEDVFQSYYNPCDFEKIFDVADCEVSTFDGKEGFVRYMTAMTDGKEITYREVSAGLGEKKKYIVLADNEKFSEFTLRKSGEKNDHRFDLWELDTITAFYQPSKSILVKALTNSTVYINDIPLTDDYIISEEIPTEVNKHLPEGVPGISYIIYKVDGLLNDPVAHVLDRKERESTLVYDENEELYTEEINYDTDWQEQFSAYVISAAETYAKYLTMDASAAQLRKYFDQTSKIYFYLSTSERYWYTPHISFRFEGSTAFDFYAFNDDVFVCRYTGTMIVNRTVTEEYRYTMDLTFYFKKINDVFMVYDMINNK